MSRPLRINYEGAFHHITARGNEKRKIFLSKADYDAFLTLLKNASQRYGVVIHCYALMGNHYHLVIETPKGLLARFMHDINSGYTTYFNVKRKRAGHLFQGRYKSLLVDKDSYLLELSRYVHLNPCRAGISEKPEDYRLSSYRAYIYPDEPTIISRDLILGMISSDPNRAPDQYRLFVEEGLAGEPPSFAPYGGMILGSKQFIKEALRKVDRESMISRETSEKKLLYAEPPTAGEIISSLARTYHVPEETITSKAPYRHYAIYLLHACTTLSNGEIGQLFGIGISAVTKAVTRLTQKMKTDRQISREVRRLEQRVSFVNG